VRASGYDPQGDDSGSFMALGDDIVASFLRGNFLYKRVVFK
jgi:hypothetical protein